MPLHVEVQVLAYIARVWNDGNRPDPYDYIVTGASTEIDHTVIMGLRSDGNFGKEHHDLILEKVSGLGFRTAEYQRFADGKLRTITLDISSPTTGVKLMSVVHGPTHNQDTNDQAHVKATASAAINDPNLHFKPLPGEHAVVMDNLHGTIKSYFVADTTKQPK